VRTTARNGATVAETLLAFTDRDAADRRLVPTI